MERKFLHIHNHTRIGSVRDSTNNPHIVADLCKRDNLSAYTITDHGTSAGWIEYFKACEKNGIKPVFGVEFYLNRYRDRIFEIRKELERLKKEKNNDNASAMVKALNFEMEEIKKNNHLVIFAKNLHGYYNILELHNHAFMKGFYGKPLITLEELFDMPKKHDDRGIILTSSCLAGVIPQNIMNEDYSKAEDHALLMREEFKDNFYLEIQAHELEEQRLVNRGLIDIHKKTKIPLCIGTDAHYPDTSYSRSHEIFLLIQGEEKVEDIGKKIWKITYETNKGEIRRKKIDFGEEIYGFKIEDINVGDHIHKKKGRMDANGKWELKINKKELVNKVWMIESADLSFKTVEQLHEHIDKFEELREIKDHMMNSNYEIYDKIEHIRPNSDLKLPFFDNDYKTLVDLCLEGMKEKKLTGKEYADRLKIELTTIKNGGLSSYFLILKDIVDYAKTDQIPAGPGRGSSGSSLVVYLLGITRLDPVKWNFNFERFLNEKKIGENLIKYRIELDDGREIELGENDMVKLKNGESKKVKDLRRDDEIEELSNTAI